MKNKLKFSYGEKEINILAEILEKAFSKVDTAKIDWLNYKEIKESE